MQKAKMMRFLRSFDIAPFGCAHGRQDRSVRNDEF